ncbi:hypothetical protein [Roseibium aggregatum]|uniref:hypothetical protein n=1 Tax=Roseibium aggregatum TaxID=187304 RepID=UPI001A8F9FDA|nr:hypothetical protein [Roseibium aggregatum]MBN8183745.1 hypothetical protein [Roseibium aggregatum]UES42483.1 hypothetical protein GFK90_01135 [Roseibium aggregatum]
MFMINAGKFIELVTSSYENKGGIDGQRDAIKTKSALSIRKRLIEDLVSGAVIPPVTIGVLADARQRDKIWQALDADAIDKVLRDIPSDLISIIDGMQRTTALIEAIAKNPEIAKRLIRVEVWCAEKINGLIYRMLVLNSGQIPWETARQLETVYSQFINTLQTGLDEDVSLFLKDERRRRVAPGQFQASTVIRLYLAFSARRAEFDLKDRVAEDFAKLDALESSSHDEFFGYFQSTFKLALALDREFSRIKKEEIPFGKVRIRDGRDIFKAEPALIGFFVAVSVKLFDVPGFDIDWSQTPERMSNVSDNVTKLVERIQKLDDTALEQFLELDVLNERLDRRSGQVGRYERDLFTRAFSLVVDRGGDLPSFKPCWLA